MAVNHDRIVHITEVAKACRGQPVVHRESGSVLGLATYQAGNGETTP